jgi:hypothetical protein
VGARFSARPDRPWGPPNLLYNGYWFFPGGKVRPARAADHSPPVSAEVLEELSYTTTPPLWATTGPVTWILYLTYIDILPRREHTVHTSYIRICCDFVITEATGVKYYVQIHKDGRK